MYMYYADTTRHGDAEFGLAGYNMFRKDRVVKPGGIGGLCYILRKIFTHMKSILKQKLFLAKQFGVV